MHMNTVQLCYYLLHDYVDYNRNRLQCLETRAQYWFKFAIVLAYCIVIETH